MSKSARVQDVQEYVDKTGYNFSVFMTLNASSCEAELWTHQFLVSALYLSLSLYLFISLSLLDWPQRNMTSEPSIFSQCAFSLSLKFAFFKKLSKKNRFQPFFGGEVRYSRSRYSQLNYRQVFALAFDVTVLLVRLKTSLFRVAGLDWEILFDNFPISFVLRLRKPFTQNSILL
jgi:hypothetical protein